MRFCTEKILNNPMFCSFCLMNDIHCSFSYVSRLEFKEHVEYAFLIREDKYLQRWIKSVRVIISGSKLLSGKNGIKRKVTKVGCDLLK